MPKAIKKYDHGGVHYDLPPSEEEDKGIFQRRRQDKEDKKGMIPARFRNRGQAGIDAAIAHIKGKEQKKRIKAEKKAKKKKKGIRKILASWKAGREAKSNEKDVSDSSSGGGSGNCSSKGCGAFD